MEYRDFKLMNERSSFSFRLVEQCVALRCVFSFHSLTSNNERRSPNQNVHVCVLSYSSEPHKQ